jgi:hypothetical protein
MTQRTFAFPCHFCFTGHRIRNGSGDPESGNLAVETVKVPWQATGRPPMCGTTRF